MIDVIVEFVELLIRAVVCAVACIFVGFFFHVGWSWL